MRMHAAASAMKGAPLWAVMDSTYRRLVGCHDSNSLFSALEYTRTWDADDEEANWRVGRVLWRATRRH